MKLPTPSMLVSVTALVVALGGTSYAAVQINGSEIKAKSIGSSRIKKDTLGSGVIKDGKIKVRDLGPDVTAAIKDGKTRWLYVNPAGQIAAQSGGFSIVAAYPTLDNTAAAGSPDNSQRANGNVYINAGTTVASQGLVATLALQNTVDQNGDGVTGGRAAGADNNPEFSGEITVAKCNFTGAVATGPVTNCAPAGAQNANSFVVSPRLSDGSVTTDNNRKGFYVVLTAS